MIRQFAGAIQFLTIIPVRGETASYRDAALFFPLTGALIGTASGFAMLVLSPYLGRSLAALIALTILIVITGGLHEDGLADVADAVRAGRTREKMMEILKDSRIGTYGALALILSAAIRWQALAQSVVNPIAGLAAALALSRTSLVALAASTLPIGTGLGQAFIASLSRSVLIKVTAQCIALVGLAAISIGWPAALLMLTSTTAIVLLARVWFLQRLGGVNGDCLGATCQAAEALNLVILACHPSF